MKPIYLYSHKDQGWAIVDDTTRRRLTDRVFETEDAAREWAQDNLGDAESERDQ